MVYSWADDLLNDEVVDGMPTDLARAQEIKFFYRKVVYEIS
jgi:hypothetical protein